MATIQCPSQPWAITGTNCNAHDLRSGFWMHNGDVAGLDAPTFLPGGSTVKNSQPYDGCRDVFVIGRLAGRAA